MANLKRRHAFKRWAPDIGENRDLIKEWQDGGEDGSAPGIWFELATGLTPVQLQEINVRCGVPIEPTPPLPEDATSEQLAGAGVAAVAHVKDSLRRNFVDGLGPYVRVVGGPHSIEGAQLETFDDYVRIVQAQADFGQLALKDVMAAHRAFNTFGGGDELFLRRRSGSSASTAAPSVVKGEPKTEGP